MRRSLTIVVALVAALVTVVTVCRLAEAQSPAPQARDGVFVHISHGPEDPHRLLMGLQMARLMAEDKDVLVYVDVTGILAITRRAPDMEKPPFPSHKELISQLVEKGVRVLACPSCMKAYGVEKKDLLPGVEVASKDAFFDFTKGRILTLDY